MASGTFRFDRFLLDPGNRQLSRDDLPLDLNARYLDALMLMVRDAGKLVSKDRFLEEVWRGVPVTDEALTQCIKTLRRLLGDSASNPSFIETVPKHGYRFIAPVEWVGEAQGPSPTPSLAIAPSPARSFSWQQFILLGLAGTMGGGLAGAAGGLFYGFAGAAQPLQAGMGAISVLLVLLCLTTLIALIGAAGVGFGIAAAGFASDRNWPWTIIGGAFGGLVVGALAKLLGLDAFNLLFGNSPGNITGAPEGALLGAGVGLGAWLATLSGSFSLRRSVAAAALSGGAAGILIPLLGGRLMGGSLDLLARSFPNSRLRLDPIGGLFGEKEFGPISQIATGAMEGLLFGGCIVGAMLIARRNLSGDPK